LIRPLLSLVILSIPVSVWAQADRDMTSDAARLRSLLATSIAEEQQCLAGATQTVWAAARVKDLQQLKERARQMRERALRGAGGGGEARDAEAWQVLQQKAEQFEALARTNARSGAELLTIQAIGLDCLDRFAGEREAYRASLEQALAEPAAYRASLQDARLNGAASLSRDLAALRVSALGLAARLSGEAAFEQLVGETAALRQQVETLKRRHVAALESELNRALAGPLLRAVELLVGTMSAWQEERAAGSAAARDEALRHKEMRWGTALELLREAVRTAK
jgi:hypothetical protein